MVERTPTPYEVNKGMMEQAETEYAKIPEPEPKVVELVRFLDRLREQGKWITVMGENLNEMVTRFIGTMNTEPDKHAEPNIPPTSHDNAYLSEMFYQITQNDMELQRLHDTIKRLRGIL